MKDVQPDYFVDVFKMDKDNSKLFFTNFVGEIKTESAIKKERGLAYLDLYRCATFSKLLMINKGLSSVMSVQVIGTCYTFYLLNFQGENLYTMIELGKITLPTTVNDFFKVKHIRILSKIVQVYKENCFTEKDIEHTPTIPLDLMKNILSTNIGKKGDDCIKIYYKDSEKESIFRKQ